MPGGNILLQDRDPLYLFGKIYTHSWRRHESVNPLLSFLARCSLMKKLSIFVLLLTTSSHVFAQELKVAPIVGINFTNNIFSQLYKEEIRSGYANAKFQPLLRFSLGGIGDYAYTDNLSFRSGLLLNFKGSQVKGSDETGNETVKIKTSYLEIPLWVAYRLGETGILLTGGPNIGFAMGGKVRSKGKMTYYGETETFDDTDQLDIGGDAYEDDVKPLDISFSIGVAKEISMAGKLLEVSVNIQPSLMSWSTTSKIESKYSARNFVVGFRAAYFFSFK